MLDLYISETCPYCQKVMEFFEKNNTLVATVMSNLGLRKYAEKNNINFTKKDVAEPENLSSLLKLGGKAQIPFLDDPQNGVSMYESDDIIEYAKNRG